MGNYFSNNEKTREEWLEYATTLRSQDAIPIYERIYPEFIDENNWEKSADILIILAKLYTDETIIADTYMSIAKLYKKSNNTNRYIFYLESSIDV